jgi:hypothetical protein
MAVAKAVEVSVIKLYSRRVFIDFSVEKSISFKGRDLQIRLAESRLPGSVDIVSGAQKRQEGW